MEQGNPNIPDDILIEIFSRIPAKAVGRCRCLSKTWRIHLSTSQFVDLHLQNRTTNPENLLLFRPSYSSFHIIDAPIVDNTVSRKLDLGITWCRVLGSCNGLVLMSNTKEELYLVNPITLEHFKLPPLSLCSKASITKTHGLGYDSSSDDYKVVVLSHWFAKAAPWIDKLTDVYSMKSGAWKRVRNPRNRYSTRMVGAFVNGAIHWYSHFSRKTNNGYVIDAFDFADDVFREVPAAPMKSPTYVRNTSLLVLEGCLCMSYHNCSGAVDIWMMKQYGLADSWTKFTTITNGDLRSRLPLCFIGTDREIVFVTCHDTLNVFYNLGDGNTRVMVVDGVPADCRKGVAFVYSLVSPHHQYSD